MLSELVTELLELLGEAQAVAPLASDTAGDPTAEPAAATENHEAALALKTSFNNRFRTDPAGATPTHKQQLQRLRTTFANTYSGMPDDERLRSIQRVFGDTVLAYTAIADELKLRALLKTQLDALALENASGTRLVPGATDDDTRQLETLRDGAALALASAAHLSDVQAVNGALKAIALARSAVQDRVEARSRQALRIRSDAAALVNPPEAPAGALDPERNQVTSPLTPPLSDGALVTAEAALLALAAAWKRADAEARALRQMRALFATEAQTLRQRVTEVAQGLPKAKQGQAAEVQRAIDNAEKKLAVTATRADTEGFPAALDLARGTLTPLVSGAVGGGNSVAQSAAIVYFLKELELLLAQTDELPELDTTSTAFKALAKKQHLDASSKLSGSGNQAKQGTRVVEAMAHTVAGWRQHVGPLGIVLGQRKTAVEQALAAATDPADCLPAFAQMLQQQRNTVQASLGQKLTEGSVAAAEAAVALLPPLRRQAEDDARHAAHVAAVRGVLSAEFDGIAAAARPAAATALARLKAEADRRAALTTPTRDMAGTARLHDALVARMREVAAEPGFAAVDQAPFGDIDDSVRQLAFNVFGPALVPTLAKADRQALSAALVSDGKAIEQLADSAFGDNTAVLAQVVRRCGAGGLVSLARAFDGDANAAHRAALEGLLAQGGLAAPPALLARLLGEPPQAGDDADATAAKQARQALGVASIRSVAENFGGDAGAAAMSALMVGCGLDSSDVILASLMDGDGFDGDGAELRQFANAFAGTSPAAKAAQADLLRLVKTGGIAEHASVVGPLAKRAGADGVKSLGAAFVEPADCANLKGLLDRGGMSGDTHRAGHAHEHADTLGKVFVDGLGGKGDNMKTYAAAFAGPDGQDQSKEMLDAFNQFPNEFKNYRKPGEGIGKLVGGGQLKGTEEVRIGKLASQFVPTIQGIGAGAQREQAIRMAPYIATDTASEGWKPKSVAMAGAGISRVTASVLKRHQPETFDRGKIGPVQSMFPPGCDVGALIDEAMGKLSADRTRAQTVAVTVAPPTTTIHVEIGFLNGDTVNHFGPRGNPGPPHPQETPTFRAAEMEAIFNAIK